MGNFFRTPELQKQYAEDRKNGSLQTCPLCTVEPKKEWEHWKIIENKYPYDRITKVHDMLVSKRHVKEEDLTTEEKEEMFRIKKEYINPNYGYMFEPMIDNKSIPDHFHVHLIVEKDSVTL